MDNEQDLLDFERFVAKHFEFLITNVGFSAHFSRPQKYTQIASYESDAVYVTLSFGPPSFEPELAFGRRAIDNLSRAYSFHPADLLALECCQDWSWSRHDNELGSWIADLARLLRTCGSECLVGNQSVYEMMKARREKAVDKWKIEEKEKSLRPKIEAAWEMQGFSIIVRPLRREFQIYRKWTRQGFHLSKSGNLIEGLVARVSV